MRNDWKWTLLGYILLLFFTLLFVVSCVVGKYGSAANWFMYCAGLLWCLPPK